jgi:hypothetical protein
VDEPADACDSIGAREVTVNHYWAYSACANGVALGVFRLRAAAIAQIEYSQPIPPSNWSIEEVTIDRAWELGEDWMSYAKWDSWEHMRQS